MASINIKNDKVVKGKLEAMADEIAAIMKQNPQTVFMQRTTFASNHTFPAHAPYMTWADDMEQRDIAAIEKLIELYFETTYPDFEPEIIHGMDKDYYLPALKVLDWDGESFCSPQRKAKWDKLELVAECERQFIHSSRLYSVYTPSEDAHDWESCQCGIYGSINLEEIADFLRSDEYAFCFVNDDKSEDWHNITKKLVLIEPSPNADVILARKGWRAQSAFISEIVGETISLEEVSRLLSITWHRTIDIRELKYENR